ncbi:MAG: hypothetical protein WB471_07390 [Nocardioides sp.]
MTSHGPLDLLPGFDPVARLRPVDLVQPGSTAPRAPYLACEVDLADPASPGIAELVFGDDAFAARWNGRALSLRVTRAGVWRNHASKRHGSGRAPDAVAISLTGPFVTGWLREDGVWVARAVLDLAEERGMPDVHDEAWLSTFVGSGDRSGSFGQLGLRDIRLVTHVDGTPYRRDGDILLTASSAGPGGFRTAHTSVWSLSPAQAANGANGLTHRGDLFFRRPPEAGQPGIYGDHATHLVRDGEKWLVATSTWGTFDQKRHPQVGVTLAICTDDVTQGQHYLDTVSLDLPDTGVPSVGMWDPHLVRTDPDGQGERWLVGYVSAERWFRFHPALATGPDLSSLSLRAAAPDRLACEGTTIAKIADRWWVLGSDGSDSRRAERLSYPVFDLDLQQHGVLDAEYPGNIPWPSLWQESVEQEDDWWLIGFDGTPYGGGLLGYGTHGDVLLQRAR